MTARSLIRWFGGKGNQLKRILPVLEGIPHRYYCEPFGGGASVLLNKRPVEIETYNDLDEALYDFFRVMADPDLFSRFYARVRYLPYSRKFYNEYRAHWHEEVDLIKRVTMWFLVARQSFSGSFGASWSSAVTAVGRDMASTTSKWRSVLAALPAFHERLTRVQIECADWRVILERYDTPDTLFYLDPPYVHSTRRDDRYAHEMTDADHADLVQALLRLRGKAVLSGYPNEIYKPLEDAGWERREWQTACYAAARTRATGIQGNGASLRMQPRTECLWISPYEHPATAAPEKKNGQKTSETVRVAVADPPAPFDLPLFTWKEGSG